MFNSEHFVCLKLDSHLSTRLCLIVSVNYTHAIVTHHVTDCQHHRSGETRVQHSALCHLLYPTVLLDDVGRVYELLHDITLYVVDNRESEGIPVCSRQRLGLQEVHSTRLPHGRSKWFAAR